MFALSVSLCGSCNTLSFTDSTGLFSIDNPLGYNSGASDTPASPNDFDTYVLTVWKPGAALDGSPTYTLDLAANVPSPDADYHFTWTITAEEVGVDPIVSGIWTAHVEASFDQISYPGDYQGLLDSDILNKIDQEILKAGPVRGQLSKCQQKLMRLKNILCAAHSAAGCGKADYAQEAINYLYKNYRKCCG